MLNKGGGKKMKGKTLEERIEIELIQIGQEDKIDGKLRQFEQFPIKVRKHMVKEIIEAGFGGSLTKHASELYGNVEYFERITGYSYDPKNDQIRYNVERKDVIRDSMGSGY